MYTCAAFHGLCKQVAKTHTRREAWLYSSIMAQNLCTILHEQSLFYSKNKNVVLGHATTHSHIPLSPLYVRAHMQVELRRAYKVPIILEESFSFGVLGPTGRGIVDHFGIDVSESQRG